MARKYDTHLLTEMRAKTPAYLREYHEARGWNIGIHNANPYKTGTLSAIEWSDSYAARIREHEEAQRDSEAATENEWLKRAEYDPEAYDEMVREDMEGRS